MKVQTFAERLKTAITTRRMTQQGLSDITKIPKSAISQYLSAKFEAKQDRVEILARALNVSEAWLMGFDVPMERDNDINIVVSEEDKKFFDLLSTMTPEEKDLFYGIMKSIIERRKE
jgi:transcriptional regulator with XRE-family HTH domain